MLVKGKSENHLMVSWKCEEVMELIKVQCIQNKLTLLLSKLRTHLLVSGVGQDLGQEP